MQRNKREIKMMGVSILILLAFFITLFSPTSQASEGQTYENYTATGDVFKRVGWNTSFESVGVIYKGETIRGKVLSNGWIRYHEDDKTYYSAGIYFMDEKNEPAVEYVEPASVSYNTKTSNSTYVQSAPKGKTQSNQGNKQSTAVQNSAPSGRKIIVQATAYSRNEAGLGNFTANGTDLRQNSRVIAVDPNVIPLGTRVYVEGYGEAVAADTGGAIKGNIIDVHLESVNDCYNWGRKNNVEVTILD